MKHLRIPNTGLDVSALCCGTTSFGTGVAGDALDRLVASFLEAGGSFFDSAHCYSFWEPGGYGASERELGACLRRLGALGRVTIATKGGHPDAGPDYRRPGHYLSPEVVAADISDSIERLGTQPIDLYLLHRDDTRVPVGEVMGMLNGEVNAGRIRYVGASNWSVSRIAESNEYARQHGLQGFAASQVQWSLPQPSWQAGPDPTVRTVTDEDAVWYAQSGMAVMAWSATAGGYLAGHDGGWDTPVNRERRERARALAARLGCTPLQVGLAYLLHQPFPVVPIFGTTRPEHLQEVLGATDVPLTAEEVGWLREG